MSTPLVICLMLIINTWLFLDLLRDFPSITLLPSRSIQGFHRLGLGVIEEAEGVTTNTCGRRLCTLAS
jgi:hypothetical protein